MHKNTPMPKTGTTENTFIPKGYDAPDANRSPSLLETQPLPAPVGFEDATGRLAYQMTNDAMFHIVFEACPVALRAFVGALLHLKAEEIISVEVTNPVEYGTGAYSKNFVLDLKIILNGSTVLNIELQVEGLSFWKERSLAYLCRIFDGLNQGDEYINIRPAIQVGILDFHIAPGDTKFYSNYYMMDEEEPHKKYSDKLRLIVLQLKQEANATEDDKTWHLDLWAKFFKARTWEEVFMVAEKDPYIADAAKTLYRACADDRIRSLCEGRERGEKTLRSLQLELQMQKEETRQRDEIIRQTQEENARLRAELDALRQQKR